MTESGAASLPRRPVEMAPDRLPLQQHPDREALQQAVLASLLTSMHEALQARGEALIGLSGGSTPLPLYRSLAALALPWSSLRFLLVDERFVPAGHAHSNETQVRNALAGAGEALRLLGLRGEAADPVAAAAAATAIVDALPRPDVLLLGMGEDGHIASLFPAGRGSAEALMRDGVASVCPVWPEPLPAAAPHPRLTLSLAALARARALLLLLSGPAKLDLLRSEAIHGLPAGRLFDPGMPPLQIHWSP